MSKKNTGQRKSPLLGHEPPQKKKKYLLHLAGSPRIVSSFASHPGKNFRPLGRKLTRQAGWPCCRAIWDDGGRGDPPVDLTCGSWYSSKTFVPVNSESTLPSAWVRIHECFDPLKVYPVEFATQITILDQEVFLRITAGELTSCGWSKRTKMICAPNVVAFTHRFNSICLWTVRQVLSGPTPEQRADLVYHFVQTASCLADLGNLHGTCAIVCALQSTPVSRLADTWGRVCRKQRTAMERLVSLFSPENNFSNLRNCTESRRGPCIPHIAPYQKELLYAELALSEESWMARLEAAAGRVLRYQYTLSSMKLTRMEHLVWYLSLVPYNDEVQKYVDDENYKLSLELEPPVRLTKGGPKEGFLPLAGPRIGSSSSSPSSGHKIVAEDPKVHELETDIFSSSSLPSASKESSELPLVHDSVLDDMSHVVAGERPMSVEWSGYIQGSSSLQNPVHEDAVVCQGCLRRKTMLKDGKKPVFSFWARFWVALSGHTLVFYPPRSLRGRGRCDFKRIPSNKICVVGWLVVEESRVEKKSSKSSFQLIHPSSGIQYKFCPGSRQGAQEWCKWLSTATTPSKLSNTVMRLE